MNARAAQRAAASPPQGRPGVDDLMAGVLAGDRAMLGRAITLIESRNVNHQRLAAELSLQAASRTPATPFASASPACRASARAPSSRRSAAT